MLLISLYTMCVCLLGALNPSCCNLVVHLVGLLGGPKTLAVGSNVHSRAELTHFLSRSAVWSREPHYQFFDPGPGWALFIIGLCQYMCGLFQKGAWVYLHILVCAVVHFHCA